MRWIWQITGFAISSHRFAHSRKTVAKRTQHARLAGEGGQLAEVDAGGEDGAFAAQDHAVHLAVVGGVAQSVCERPQQLLVHRVALLRAVQDDVADRAAVFGDDDAHRGSSFECRCR